MTVNVFKDSLNRSYPTKTKPTIEVDDCNNRRNVVLNESVKVNGKDSLEQPLVPLSVSVASAKSSGGVRTRSLTF